MDRNTYLTLCKKCAIMCEEGKYFRKVNVPDDLQVIYEVCGYGEHAYYPLAYELSFNNDGTPKHTAILHALNANSITSAPLEEVRPKNID